LFVLITCSSSKYVRFDQEAHRWPEESEGANGGRVQEYVDSNGEIKRDECTVSLTIATYFYGKDDSYEKLA
jgi:hypothetical protein